MRQGNVAQAVVLVLSDARETGREDQNGIMMQYERVRKKNKKTKNKQTKTNSLLPMDPNLMEDILGLIVRVVLIECSQVGRECLSQQL